MKNISKIKVITFFVVAITLFLVFYQKKVSASAESVNIQKQTTWQMEPPKLEVLSDWSVSSVFWLGNTEPKMRYVKIGGQLAVQTISGNIAFVPKR